MSNNSMSMADRERRNAGASDVPRILHYPPIEVHAFRVKNCKGHLWISGAALLSVAWARPVLVSAEATAAPASNSGCCPCALPCASAQATAAQLPSKRHARHVLRTSTQHETCMPRSAHKHSTRDMRAMLCQTCVPIGCCVVQTSKPWLCWSLPRSAHEQATSSGVRHCMEESNPINTTGGIAPVQKALPTKSLRWPEFP